MPYPVPVTLAQIERNGEISYNGEVYTLKSITFDNEKQKDYVKAYDDKLRELAKMIGTDPEVFIYDFKTTMENGIGEDGELPNIREFLEEYHSEKK